MSSAWNVQNVESEQDMNSKQIDQLRARISELEFVVSRKDKAIAERTERIAELEAAHAAAVLSNVQLREALTTCVCAMQDYQAGIGITEMFDKGERLGRKALALPRDTSALDAYVVEKLKEAEARTGNKSPCYQIARDMAVRMWERYYKDDAPNWQPLDDFIGVLSQISNMLTGLGNVEELTRQRDLAVNALEAIAGRRIFIDNLASNVDIAVMTLDAIKESEEN